MQFESIVVNKIWLALQHHVDTHQSLPTLLIAYSGGKDSQVLLHSLVTIRNTVLPNLNLLAYHVNHGLSPHSGEWETFCQQTCDSWQVAFKTSSLKLKKEVQLSLEAQAREKRYTLFRQSIHKKDILLTAHTQNDQAETVLLALMRGSGVRGMSGIHPSHLFGEGLLLRPMLSVSSTEVYEYLKVHGLRYISDPSNQERVFRRNCVRHDIVPAIEKIAPAFTQKAAHFAQVAYDTQTLLDDYLSQEIKHISNANGALSVNALQSFLPAKRQAILRLWIKSMGHSQPSEKKLATIMEQMFHANLDRSPCVEWADAQVRRYKNHLFIMPNRQQKVADFKEQKWDLQQPLIISQYSQWHAHKTQGKGINATMLCDPDYLVVRLRQSGDKILLPGRSNRTKLKKFMNERRIPYWQRDSLPLFFHKDCLVAIGNLWVSELYSARENQLGWQIIFIQSL